MNVTIPSTPKDVQSIFFGNFNDQPIPYKYYNFLNDENVDGNIITGTSVDYSLLDNEGEEYSVVPNNEYINYEIIIDDDESLDLYIDPPPKQKEGD